MQIFIGSDHGGFKLKEEIGAFLKNEKISVSDVGCYSLEAVDYPDYAKRVAEEVLKSKDHLGILLCGTGIGMSIAANKISGIRCALVGDCFSAKMSREHNHANIVALGERVTGTGLAIDIVHTWLKAEFQGNRHENRVKKIHALEGKC